MVTGPDTRDQGVDVFASGWGLLYEKEDRGGADCNTGPGRGASRDIETEVVQSMACSG